MNNDVSVIVSITAAAALTYGVVIWRARAVARRMEEDVSNIWIGDGTPMVSDVDNFDMLPLLLLHAAKRRTHIRICSWYFAAECDRWRIPRISIPHRH